MVSLVNSSLCNENGNKSPMENGHIIPVKYKPRKVSAFRDFPPGCGRNVPIINVNPLETTVGVVVADKAEDVVAAHGAKTLEIDMKSESDVLRISVNPQETTESLVVANKIEDKLEAETEVLVKTDLTEGKTWTLEKGQLCDGDVQALVIKPESREAEAQLFANEELHKVEVRAMVKNVCERVDQSVLEIGDKPDVSVQLDSEKLSSPHHLPNCNVIKTSSKNKYTQRRVSATRDFPPFCGRNAPPLTDEDRFKINYGNKCLIAVEKDCFENGVFRETLKDVMEGGTSRWTASAGGEELEEKDQHGNTQKSELMEIVCASSQKSFAVIQKSSNDVAGDLVEKVVNEIVVFSQEESLSGKMSMDEVDLGGGLDRIIVQGLMAAASDPLNQEGALTSPDYGMSRSKAKKRDFTGQEKSKLGSKKKTTDKSFSSRESKKKLLSAQKAGYGDILDLVINEKEDYVAHNEDKTEASPAGQGSCEFEVEKDCFENGVFRETLKDVMEGGTSSWTSSAGGEALEEKDQHGNTQKSELMEIVCASSQKSFAVIQQSGNDVAGDLVEKVGNEIVLFSQEESLSRKMSTDEVDLGGGLDRIIVQGLMAASSDPLKQEGALTSPDYGMSRSKAKKRDFTGQEKSKLGSKRKTTDKSFSSRESKKKLLSTQKAGYGDILDLVIKDEENYVAHNEDKTEASPAGQGSREFEVTLPPFGPNSSSHGDARNKVRESLRLFQAICRKILQGEESKSRLGEQTKSRQKDIKRIDLVAAKIIKEKGKEVNTDKQILGAVPGVEVGDEFQYRVELAIVGIHRLYQAGIDYTKYRGENVAASIVASGGYADELDNADVLIYSGQGGIVGKDKDKQHEDQKLKRGNLALKNSISAKNAVRVIRGSKETKASDSVDARGKGVMTYVYDGLYTVDRYWQEVGPHGKLVFKFELRRIPGQPELAWKEVKKSKKSKTREGLCVDDISGGKEVIPICAVNTIDDEKPPPFSYITKMIYPDHCLPFPPNGCDCKSGCLDGRTCLCAAKNGEIPYNFNGAIVEMKPLVYECGPLCKCPPSCCNRVSQHGIRFQLEIFKTESRGWGVRSLNSISAGSFICEYTGELLEDTEAEKRTGNDEYLFDIGQNYNDCSLKPDEEACSSKIVEDGGFTIDAAQCGNVGRFINHSCSPNLYAQNVLYDHEDRRMPHIMFFAAENIPPLQELTYHYNYAVDQIHDSNGNIKMKRCYCGSAECTGRMY